MFVYSSILTEFTQIACDRARNTQRDRTTTQAIAIATSLPSQKLESDQSTNLVCCRYYYGLRESPSEPTSTFDNVTNRNLGRTHPHVTKDSPPSRTPTNNEGGKEKDWCLTIVGSLAVLRGRDRSKFPKFLTLLVAIVSTANRL